MKIIFKKSSDNQWRFNFVANNGEIVATSESYHNYGDMVDTIKLIRDGLPTAKVFKETTKVNPIDEFNGLDFTAFINDEPVFGKVAVAPGFDVDKTFYLCQDEADGAEITDYVSDHDRFGYKFTWKFTPDRPMFADVEDLIITDANGNIVPFVDVTVEEVNLDEEK